MKIDSLVPNIPERTNLAQVIKALQKRLTFEDNFRVSIVTVPDTGPANTSFTINHTLEKIPTLYFANLDQAGDVYDYQRNLWTASQLTLKCSVANAAATIAIF